jgi:hypothetical protein
MHSRIEGKIVEKSKQNMTGLGEIMPLCGMHACIVWTGVWGEVVSIFFLFIF